MINRESGWSSAITKNLNDIRQYGILKQANLAESNVNGPCLIRTDIDLDKKWDTGMTDAQGNPVYETNRERMSAGKPPLDSKGRPIELHHLGQEPDSPLVELTVEEHRTGEYESGKKNDGIWHNKLKKSTVHGANEYKWCQARKAYWRARIAAIGG